MSSDQQRPNSSLEHVRLHARTAPLCYARRQRSHAIDPTRVDAQSYAALILLSILTCAAILLVVYGGWSF